MKEVARLPAPKAWSLSKNAEGKLIVGYVPNTMGYAKLSAAVKAADEYFADPTSPRDPRYVAAYNKPTPQESLGDVVWNGEYRKEMTYGRIREVKVMLETDSYREKVAKFQKELEIYNTWRAHKTWAGMVPLDYLPVFEEVVEFTGYGRGRSSVTMDFKADDGQEFSFAPGGISELFSAILNGSVQVVGGKLKMRFTFAKQGQNIYAKLVPLAS